MQNTMGEAPDDPPDARWVSYAELGHLRGIGRESAIRLARREKWPRQPGNDGSTRVLVPPEWLKPSRDNPPERADRRSPEGPGEFGRAIRAFEHAAAALAARAEQAEAGRQAAEAQAEAERSRARSGGDGSPDRGRSSG